MLLQAGRECADGEKGMQPAGTTVVLGAKTTKWQIVPAGGSCSSVYIKVTTTFLRIILSSCWVCA